jgi:hypothetical protein
MRRPENLTEPALLVARCNGSAFTSTRRAGRHTLTKYPMCPSSPGPGHHKPCENAMEPSTASIWANGTIPLVE